MNKTNLSEIGRRIQLLRKNRGYTQEQVAEKMNVSIQMISNLERGNKAIRIDNLLNLSSILDVSTDYILTGRDSTKDVSDLATKIASLEERDRELLKILVDYCEKTK